MVFDVEMSILENSDGSAKLIHDNQKVIVSVCGPIEAKVKEEKPNNASLKIHVRSVIGQSSTREKFIESKLQSLLEGVIITHYYPQRLILINVQFLCKEDNSDDFFCNELSAAINCCFFALIDANISLMYTFSSASICLIDNEIKENPCINELYISKSHHLVCYEIKDGKVNRLLMLESNGEMTEQELFFLLESSARICEQISINYQRKFINEKINKDFIRYT